jgi:hypothetical protein
MQTPLNLLPACSSAALEPARRIRRRRQGPCPVEETWSAEAGRDQLRQDIGFI